MLIFCSKTLIIILNLEIIYSKWEEKYDENLYASSYTPQRKNKYVKVLIWIYHQLYQVGTYSELKICSMT